MDLTVDRPWFRVVLAALAAMMVACSSASPAPSAGTVADAPPEDEWVSSGTTCLGNGTVHDPNPAGCTYNSECRRSPVSQGGDWAHGWIKSECSNIDWMTGISTDATSRDHNLLCASTSYSNLTGGSIPAASCTVVWATATSTTYPASGGLMPSDWDPSTAGAPVAKLECPGNSHVSGYARDGDGNVASILCCTIAGETAKTNCAAQTYALGAVDARESSLTGDWDPGFPKLECGTGRVMGGLSTLANGGSTGSATNQGAKLGRVHGVLCCDASPAFSAQSTYNANPLACATNNDCRVSPTTWDTGEWANGYVKLECAETDVMTGISVGANNGIHQHHCALSNYTNASGGNATVASNMVSINGGYVGSYPSALSKVDWDPGYAKKECGAGQHLAGISVKKGMVTVGNTLCASFPGESAQTNCAPVTFGNTGLKEAHESTTTSGDWSPGYYKLECGQGRVISGVSVVNGSAVLHGILCCDSTPTQAYSSCCNDTSFKASVASCVSNATKNAAACNLVDYCCQPGMSAHAGSYDCEEVALAEDPSKEGGTGLSVAPQSSPVTSSPTCGSGGPAKAWSFSFTQSKIRGNANFGTFYEASVLLSADSMLNASGEAKMAVGVALFGKKGTLASFDANAILQSGASNTASISVQALGQDVGGFPIEGTSHLDHEASWTQMLFEKEKVYIVGGVPVTVTLGLEANWGINDSLDLSAATLTVNAEPWCNLTGTASAAVGGGVSGWASTTVGIEGSLTFVDLSFNNTAVVSPTAADLTYSVTGALTSRELSGKVSAFVKTQFLWFKKKWSTTIARFSAGKQVTPYLDYHGCVTF